MPASAERFVRTKAIRAAVKGRESDILDALGIAWRNSRPHISCPYPDHDDHDPSWRFDTRTRRALCTCITDRKSDGIFDVVIKMKAVDFDAAKIYVAETLHRDDLIKTKGGNSSNQKTDPQSLLNPPANNRDDEIPPRYLAARLGIAPDQIPAPSTKMAGITSLAYFDAPLKSGKNNKPVLVGHWPCAIFETIAVDSRRHAYRIYVNQNIDGKAELGQDARGRERDPKKSAQRDPKGPSTAGFCVVWGNPDVEHIVLTEGIENACAIAVSFREEIEKGEIGVLSAITAGGIEAFIPWPATRRITVAADRDEAKPGAGFRRGEQAARNFALQLAKEAGSGEQTIWRNADHDLPVTVLGEPEPGPDGRLYQQVQYRNEPPSYVPADELHTVGRQLEILIALPGQPGTAYDFLDLFRETDPDRVRAIIGAASPFRPTSEEIEEFKNRGRRRSEIEEIAAAFPIPPLIGLRVEYRHTQLGEIWLHRFVKTVEDKETGEVTETWAPVCTPMTPAAFLRMIDANNTYALRMMVADTDGGTCFIDFNRGDLVLLGASEIRFRLLEAGLRVANSGEMTIVEILKQVKPPIEIVGVSNSAFLTPGGERWSKSN